MGIKEIDKTYSKLNALANDLRNRFDLDSLSAEERKALDIALNDIYYETKEAERAKDIESLKEKYEKKYFNIDDKRIVYIDTIEDTFLYKGWCITDNESDKNQKRWTISSGLFRDGLFSDKFSMAGSHMEDAPIKRARELTQFEVNDWLEKWFEQTQQELIYGICNKQQN